MWKEHKFRAILPYKKKTESVMMQLYTWKFFLILELFFNIPFPDTYDCTDIQSFKYIIPGIWK